MAGNRLFDEAPIPGGNPERPSRYGKTRHCTTRGCRRPEFKQGLCDPCWSEHEREARKRLTVDEVNEAFERAKDSSD